MINTMTMVWYTCLLKTRGLVALHVVVQVCCITKVCSHTPVEIRRYAEEWVTYALPYFLGFRVMATHIRPPQHDTDG